MGKSNKGISNLAGVLDSRIGRHTEQGLVIEFGTIKKNGTLQTDTYPNTIDKNDFTMLLHCKSAIKEKTETRVLVAWVESEAVVVGILVE